MGVCLGRRKGGFATLLPFEFFGGTDRGDYLRYRGRIVNAWSMLITELSPSQGISADRTAQTLRF
jgi:hypothetical protein